MTMSEYEVMFEQFVTAEINNSSLSDYKSLIQDFFYMEKMVLSEIEILKIYRIPAEIGNPKLEEFGEFFFL
jgi:hypothetical protein